MKHPLTFLLRVGRSDDERVSLLGDLEEEHRARLARGSGQLSASVWYTKALICAFGCGLRDLVALLTTHHAPRTNRGPHTGPRYVLFSWPDIKLSLQLLIRNPGLTVVSTVGIAVGIAIWAAMFGYIHSNFDPTLPLDEGNRIVALENWDVAGNNENRHSLHDFVTWRDQMTSVVEWRCARRAGWRR